MRGLALLLAAVPAAIALLPLTWWFARSRSHRAGIDWPSRRTLDIARGVDVVLLGRWGTVTTGELKVSAVEPLDPDHERNLRWFAGALGHGAQDHDPVARAVARLAARGKLTGVERHDGDGISGSVDRHPVRVGRPGWLGMEGREGLGLTVGVQVDSRPIGYITVADDVRPDARAGVERLRATGVEVVLVSDDGEQNTRHLAELCGVERWHAGLAPCAGSRIVAEHRARRRVVAVAGMDGTTGADLTFQVDEPGPGRVRVLDLDVVRIAAALRASRRWARATTVSRFLGIALGALGVALAAAGLLPVLAALGWALLGAAVVLVASARA